MPAKPTMKPMSKRPLLRVVSGDLREMGLPAREATLFNEMLDAYQARRLGSLRHMAKSVARDIGVIFDFLRFTGKAPWSWDENDFDRWFNDLGVIRKLAVPSQRQYQIIIRKFLEYLVENVRFNNEARRLFDKSIRQICTRDNCVPHNVEREMAVERRAFTHQEIDKLFGTLDKMIEEAYRFTGSKDLHPLQRDKAFFYTMYIGGLRISETIRLDDNSFHENAEFPEFGKHGFFSVLGKGSKGSGPRHRLVPITHIDLPPLLKWYETEIRPHFQRHANANETAYFISERGRRVTLSGMEARFQHILRCAGLDGRNLVPHSLRHSSVTHEAMRLSPEAVRRKHGHAYQSTTQGYYDVPDDYVRDEYNKAIRAQLDRAKKKEQDDGKQKN